MQKKDALFPINSDQNADRTEEHIASTDTSTSVDDLDSRFLVLTNAINHFCYLTRSNTAFDYKATFWKTKYQK